MHKVYLVEDDTNIREIIKYALGNQYNFQSFENYSQLKEALIVSKSDLIILDIMLEGINGDEILKRLRDDSEYRHIPIIMLSAKSSEVDKLACFNLGADDYITKPFSVLELLARVNAVLKRTSEKKQQYVCDGLVLNLKTFQVFIDDEELKLTKKEFKLLENLMKNKGVVVERRELLENIWGYNYEGDSRTLDMHIKTLRKKIGPYYSKITTVRGVGFKFDD